MIFNRFRTPEKKMKDTKDSSKFILNPSIDSNLQTHHYTDFNQFGDEKFFLEKRRRHQIYSFLDYSFAGTTPISFFSFDTIHFLEQAKQLAEALDRNKDVFGSEFLLLSFLYSDSKLTEILNYHQITEKKVEEEIDQKIQKKVNCQKKEFFDLLEKMEDDITEMNSKLVRGKTSFFQARKDTFLEALLPFQLSLSSLSSKIFRDSSETSNLSLNFGADVKKILRRATTNSFKRFKTPVITPEILFLTLMEYQKMEAGKIIMNCLPNSAKETEWHVLRYKLIKKIHYQESQVRAEKKNIHFFAYLLKLNATESDFDQMIQNKVLSLAISTFRNKMVAELLRLDLFAFLEDDIRKESKVLKERNYSN